jgi:hypothetical protein
VAQGRTIFRFETYGDESFWTDTMRLHEVIRSTVSPTTALSVGLKVDVDALPASVKAGIEDKTISLNNPATTVALLKLGAVLGVIGQVDASNTLTRVGISCAFCHSTVDNSFRPGIGHRLDGWPNRDLNVGAIIALSPTPTAVQKAVYSSWGPGKYDPRFNVDGKNIPVVIPPAFGLRHVQREIYTGDDTISYWNAYVAITQMHGHGHFVDPGSESTSTTLRIWYHPSWRHCVCTNSAWSGPSHLPATSTLLPRSAATPYSTEWRAAPDATSARSTRM